eukprot:757135-Rhodomonas_salina.1
MSAVRDAGPLPNVHGLHCWRGAFKERVLPCMLRESVIFGPFLHMGRGQADRHGREKRGGRFSGGGLSARSVVVAEGVSRAGFGAQGQV